MKYYFTYKLLNGKHGKVESENKDDLEARRFRVSNKPQYTDVSEVKMKIIKVSKTGFKDKIRNFLGV